MKSYQTITSSNQALKQRPEESESPNAYLRKQLGEWWKLKQKLIQSPSGSVLGEGSEAEGHSRELPSEEKASRCSRRERRPTITNFNDFKVEIPEFKGKLNPDKFLEWLHTVEWILEYKEIPDDKKVRLVALRLCKYALLWWTNLCVKQVRNHKDKIRTWEKMKNNLKAGFLPTSYVQDSYSQLHNLTQVNMSVDEYAREFEKLLIEFDIQ